MAAITFRRNVSSRAVDAWAERTWQIPATGEPGSASIRLPYTSAAANATYIDPNGGSWVEIADEGGCGKWVGIVREIEYGETEIRLACQQPWCLFGDRVLHWESKYLHPAPVGYYVRKILTEVLPGMPWFWVRYWNEGSDPIIRDFEINGQDAWGALVDLMEQCGSELVINPETGEITWEGALSGDLRQTAVIIAGGNLKNWSYRASGTERAGEVMAKSGTQRYSAYSGATAIAYPGQVTITADGSLYGAATAELARRTYSAVTISGQVPSTLFSIRERDFLRVVVPMGKFTGAEHPCRVLGRTRSDDNADMPLMLQVIDELAGVVTAPPMRGGSARTSGAKGRGSFSQRFRSNQRLTWLQWLRDH